MEHDEPALARADLEVADQPRLADPGLAGQQQQLRLRARDRVEQHGEQPERLGPPHDRPARHPVGHGRNHSTVRNRSPVRYPTASGILAACSARCPPRAGPEDVLAHVGPGADVILPLANGEPVGAARRARARERAPATACACTRCTRCTSGRTSTAPSATGCATSPTSCRGATREAYWAGGCDLVPNHFSEMPRLLRAQHAPPDRAGGGEPARPRGLLLARHERRLRGGADRQGAVLPRGQRADAAHVRPQPDPRLAAARLLRGRPAARRGPAGAARRARPRDRRRDRRADPRRRDAAGRHRRHPERGARGARRPPRPGHPHRAAGRRHRRPRRGAAWPPACASSCGATRSRRRSASARSGCTTGCTTTARSSCCRSTSSTTRAGSPREDDFISINATTEVDLYGQCASETIAGRYWSSSGGQADFARGAMYSPGGQAFIVLHSTTRQGPQPDPRAAHRGLGRDDAQEHRRPRRDRVGHRQAARPLAGRPRAGADRDRASRPPRRARARGARGGLLRGRGPATAPPRAPRHATRPRASRGSAALPARRRRAARRLDGARARGRARRRRRPARAARRHVGELALAALPVRGREPRPRGARRRPSPATALGLVVTAGAPERIVAHAMYAQGDAGARRGRLRGRRRLARPRHRDDPARPPRRRGGARRRHHLRRLRAPVEPPHDRRLPRVRLPGRGARARRASSRSRCRPRSARPRGARFEDRGRAAAAAAVEHVLRPASVAARDGRRDRGRRDRDAQPARRRATAGELQRAR